MCLTPFAASYLYHFNYATRYFAVDAESFGRDPSDAPSSPSSGRTLLGNLYWPFFMYPTSGTGAGAGAGTADDGTLHVTTPFPIMPSMDKIDSPIELVRSYIRRDGDANCDVFAGPSYSDAAVAQSPLVERPMWIDYGSTTTVLSNKATYPAFLRTVPSDDQCAPKVTQLLDYFGWEAVFLIKGDTSYANSWATSFVASLVGGGGHVVQTYTIPKSYASADPAEAEAAVEAVLSAIAKRPSESRVVVAVDVPFAAMSAVAARLGLSTALTIVYSEMACSDSEYSVWSDAPGSFCLTTGFDPNTFDDYMASYATNVVAAGPSDPTSPDPLPPAVADVQSGLAAMGYTPEEALARETRDEMDVYLALAIDAAWYGLAVLSRYRSLHNGELPPSAAEACAFAIASNVSVKGLTGDVSVDANGDRKAFAATLYNSAPSGAAEEVGLAGSDGGVDIDVSSVYILGKAYDLRGLSSAEVRALIPRDRVGNRGAFVDGSASLASSVIVAIVVAAVGFLAIAAGYTAFVVMRRMAERRRRGAATRYAPKDSAQPVAIAFTDIQSSTALWAECPAEMSAALDLHNTIIRQCIAAHKGYEVKTIGDSFMVAFTSPSDAACFSIAVQQDLFAADWTMGGGGNQQHRRGGGVAGADNDGNMYDADAGGDDGFAHRRDIRRAINAFYACTVLDSYFTDLTSAFGANGKVRSIVGGDSAPPTMDAATWKATNNINSNSINNISATGGPNAVVAFSGGGGGGVHGAPLAFAPLPSSAERGGEAEGAEVSTMQPPLTFNSQYQRQPLHAPESSSRYVSPPPAPFCPLGSSGPTPGILVGGGGGGGAPHRHTVPPSALAATLAGHADVTAATTATTATTTIITETASSSAAAKEEGAASGVCSPLGSPTRKGPSGAGADIAASGIDSDKEEAIIAAIAGSGSAGGPQCLSGHRRPSAAASNSFALANAASNTFISGDVEAPLHIGGYHDGGGVNNGNGNGNTNNGASASLGAAFGFEGFPTSPATFLHNGLRVRVGAAYGYVTVRATVRDAALGGGSRVLSEREVAEAFDMPLLSASSADEGGNGVEKEAKTMAASGRRKTAAAASATSPPIDINAVSFDYFGSTVNAAARVESVGHGGQTLLTKALVSAAVAELRGSVGNTNAAGYPPTSSAGATARKASVLSLATLKGLARRRSTAPAGGKGRGPSVHTFAAALSLLPPPLDTTTDLSSILSLLSDGTVVTTSTLAAPNTARSASRGPNSSAAAVHRHTSLLVTHPSIPLRGIADPVDLVEVHSPMLFGRVFPPLRLDRAEKGEPEEEDGEGSGGEGGGYADSSSAGGALGGFGNADTYSQHSGAQGAFGSKQQRRRRSSNRTSATATVAMGFGGGGGGAGGANSSDAIADRYYTDLSLMPQIASARRVRERDLRVGFFLIDALLSTLGPKEAAPMLKTLSQRWRIDAEREVEGLVAYSLVAPSSAAAAANSNATNSIALDDRRRPRREPSTDGRSIAPASLSALSISAARHQQQQNQQQQRVPVGRPATVTDGLRKILLASRIASVAMARHERAAAVSVPAASAAASGSVSVQGSAPSPGGHSAKPINTVL